MTGEILRVAGAALLLLAAVGFIRLYRAYLGTRVAFFDEFISLIGDLRRHISTHRGSVAEIVAAHSGGRLGEVGFATAYKASGSLCKAFSDVRGQVNMPEDALRSLSEYFRTYGTGYTADELAAADGEIATLERMAKAEKEASLRSQKAASATAVAIALGLVVLLV